MMQYKTSLLKYNYGWLILGLVIIIGSSISYTAIINNYFQNLNNLIHYVGALYIFSIVLGLLMISIQIQKVLMGQREIKLNNDLLKLRSMPNTISSEKTRLQKLINDNKKEYDKIVDPKKMIKPY